jgi:hypothetical protein
MARGKKNIFLRMSEIWEKVSFSNGFLLETVRKYRALAFSNGFIVEIIMKCSDIFLTVVY